MPEETYILNIRYENIERNVEIEVQANKEIYLAYVDVGLSWLDESRRNIEYFFMP